jgi:hypothetical protein
MLEISPNSVFVTSQELDTFAKSWPCSGMRFDRDIAVSFDFASNGDLTGISWFDCSDDSEHLDIGEPEGIDQSALLALSQDAGDWLRAQKQGGNNGQGTNH